MRCMVGAGEGGESIARRLAEQAIRNELRVAVHAHQEMVEEDINYESLRQALSGCRVIENYPEHRRGPCCLVCGQTRQGRYVHVVCTTSVEVAVIITVYEPKPQKWLSPFQRGS